MWLFKVFTKSSSDAALNARLCVNPTSSSNMPRAKEGTLRTYVEVVSYVLRTYAYDAFTAKTDAALSRYIQQQIKLSAQCAEDLVI